MSRTLILVLPLALAATGCLDAFINDDTTGVPPAGRPDTDAPDDGRDLHGIAVLGSDYAATTLSLLTAAGQVSADTILHSGSTDPRLSSALSGDAVLARNPSPSATVVLLDRAQSVLTWFEPQEAAVLGQLVLGTPGFNGVNPQDYLDLGDGRAYVARWGVVRDGRGRVREGDDLAIVDLEARRIRGRIALSAEAAAVDTTDGSRTWARPARLLPVGGLVYVLLQSLTDDYRNGALVLAVVDPDRDAVVGRLAVPQKSNCGDMVYAAETSSVVVVCSGGYADADQLGQSGIVVVAAASPETPRVERVIDAAEFATQPLAATLALVGGSRVAVVEQGMLDLASFAVLSDDIVHLLDVTAPTVTAVEVSRVHDAWVTTLFGDEAGGRLFVAEAVASAPRLQVFRDRDGDGVPELVGRRRFAEALPPRDVRGY